MAAIGGVDVEAPAADEGLTSPRGASSSDSEGSESSTEAERNRKGPCKSLAEGTRKLMAVNRFAHPDGGEQQRTLEQKVRLDRPQTEEQRQFVSKVLNFMPLMLKSGRALQTFQDPEVVANHALLMDLVASALHKIKVQTSNVAWLEHVAPLKLECERAVLQKDKLETQLREVRTDYLHEIAALRDNVRVRGDPTQDISYDVVFWYDPSKALSTEEQHFLVHSVKEQMKMLVEHNPKVAQTFDFGQLQTLVARIENSESQQLRAALLHKTQQVHCYEKAIEEEEKRLKVDNDGKCSVAMYSHLDRQVEELRTKLWEEQCKLKEAENELLSCRKQVKAFKLERSELNEALMNETRDKLIAMDELERSRCTVVSREDLLMRNADLEKRCQELGGKITELETAAREALATPSHSTSELEARCGELEEILESHAIGLAVCEAEEEADDFVHFADELGGMLTNPVCEHCLTPIVSALRGCQECKRSGGRTTVFSVIAQLEETVQRLTAEIESAQAEAGSADEAARLVRERRLAEAALLVARMHAAGAGSTEPGSEAREAADAGIAASSESEPRFPRARGNPCGCSCAEELAAAKETLKSLQRFCAELTRKFKAQAEDNVKLNAALQTVREQLGSIDLSARDPSIAAIIRFAMEAARCKDVFERLYEDSRDRIRRRKQLRERLSQANAKVYNGKLQERPQEVSPVGGGLRRAPAQEEVLDSRRDHAQSPDRPATELPPLLFTQTMATPRNPCLSQTLVKKPETWGTWGSGLTAPLEHDGTRDLSPCPHQRRRAEVVKGRPRPLRRGQPSVSPPPHEESHHSDPLTFVNGLRPGSRPCSSSLQTQQPLSLQAQHPLLPPGRKPLHGGGGNGRRHSQPTAMPGQSGGLFGAEELGTPLVFKSSRS